MQRFQKHAERFDTEVIADQIHTARLRERPFVLEGDMASYSCDALVIATGATAKYLGLPSEQKYMGRGVSACATCDGFFFKGKELLVIGGGDSALEEANFLTKFATRVSVVHRRDKLRASKIMQVRAMHNEKISFIWNSVVEDILGKDVVTGAQLKNVVTGKISEIPCAGVFVAIGHRPNTSLFAGQIDMDEKGYIRTHNGTATNVPGIFAAGDVQDSTYRQAVTAAGSGCMAAIDVERFLETTAHNL
jgi:thioredoxin reductase (NADPH)